MAVVALLGLAAPASADKLVSNTGKTQSSAVINTDYAQGFRTGSNSRGYTLTHGFLHMAKIGTNTASYSVSIHSDSSGKPGTNLGTLTQDGEVPSSPGAVRFNASGSASGSGIELSSSTTYWLVLDVSDAGTWQFRRTSSDDEDSGGAAGWTIHDTTLFRGRDATSWGTTSSALSMSIEVHGHANTDPTVAHEIPNQSVSRGEPFSYQFPANTFSDADGDTLTYTATAAGGGALPAWLSFAPSSRTFSGTAPNTTTTVSVKVTAGDGTATVDDIFDITVTLNPSFSSATVNGTTLKVTFSENLDATSRPFGNQMWVTATKNGATRDINGGAANRVSISGKTVTMTLVSAIVPGETVVMYYRKADNPASVPLRGVTVNSDVANFSDKPVTNNTGRPVLSRAVIFADDFTKLRLVFDRNLAAAANLANDAFAVKKKPSGGSETNAPLSATAPSISGKTVTLTLASAVATTDTVKVSYTKPTTGTDNRIKSTAGVEADSFSDQAVTVSNNRPPVFTNYLDGTKTVTADMSIPNAPPGSLVHLPFRWSAFSDPDGDTLTQSISTTRADMIAEGPTVIRERAFLRHKSTCALNALTVTVPASHVTVVTLTVTDPHGGSASAKRRYPIDHAASACATLKSAAVDGTALTLTYEHKAEDNLPPSLSASEFTVKVGGTEVKVTAVSAGTVTTVGTGDAARAQKPFTLTLAESVWGDQTATVTYDPADTGLHKAPIVTDHAVTVSTANRRPTFTYTAPTGNTAPGTEIDVPFVVADPNIADADLEIIAPARPPRPRPTR